MDTQFVQASDQTQATFPDAADIAALLAGDKTRFEPIMRRHNQRLFRLARSILKDHAEAEDALQEAYIKALSKLQQFEGPAGFPGWLSRIVMNESLSRRRRTPANRFSETQPDSLSETASRQPEREAVQSDVLSMIEAAIDRLPLEFRLVFMLRAVEELSVTETAEHLEIKEATVKTRYHRARKLLRGDLSERVENTVLDAFSFDGARCDRVVTGVLARITESNN